MAGIETSAQGLTDSASTTRKVLGGSDQLGSNLGGGGGASTVTAAPAPSTASTPVTIPATGSTQPTTTRRPSAGLLLSGPIGVAAYAAQMRKLAA